jgi:2-dehydropantoate 2-reductase
MNIAIIGAGAIGSVVAAYLVKSGQQVTLVGKPEQAAVISRKGLDVQGVRGNESFPMQAVSRLDKEYDLVLFTVKTQDLQDAIDTNRNFLRNGILLSSQNGVQADHILQKSFPRERIVSSIVMFGATYTKPGEVTFNFEGDWILGRPSLPVDPMVHQTADVLKQAFPVVVSQDIIGMKWLKLFVNFNNCLPALTGLSMQETFADMDLCRLSILLLKEGVGIVQKAGIQLVSLPQFPVEKILGLVSMPLDQAAGIIKKTLTGLSREPLYGSILQSILRRRPSEIEFINGEVVHLARQSGVDAPLNDRVVEMVHFVESEEKFFTSEKIMEIFDPLTQVL